MKLISIDPSINYMGIAVFTGKGLTWQLTLHELLQPKTTSDDYIEKSWSMYLQVRIILEEHEVDKIILEVPDNFGVAGYHARESGSIQKLTFVCGIMYSLRVYTKIQTVLPRQWKGQLSKEATYNRMNKLKLYNFDFHQINNNISDAICIGHWAIYGKV